GHYFTLMVFCLFYAINLSSLIRPLQEYNKGLGKKADKQKTGSDSSSSSSSDLGTDVAPVATSRQETEEEKPKEEDERKCETCGKAYNEKCDPKNKDGKPLDFDDEGTGAKLTAEINKKQGYASMEEHPWYYVAGDRKNKNFKPGGKEFTINSSLQAHHLIVTNVIKMSPDIKSAAKKFGYNINSKNNGVMLPSKMELACHLGVPLHNTKHDNTVTTTKYVGQDKNDPVYGFKAVENRERNKSGGDMFMPYPAAVAKLVRGILENSTKNDECLYEAAVNQFIIEMNERSKEILINISDFSWTITPDGKDYEIGENGCGMHDSQNHKFIFNKIMNKNDKTKEQCSLRALKKSHQFGSSTHESSKNGELKIISNSNVKLEIGS
ncbi:MAG: AHH domain-containing protein, partial [Saccharospirillaceae bacterium]|nr:AHH domain-containing protein [Saccharospirillaceae bacterium]